MKFKKAKLKSKKGETLVELIVGITIIVIVFAGTLGATVNGYMTTLYNAEQNRLAVKSVAVNEVITKTVKSFKLKSESDYTADMRDMVSNTIKQEFSGWNYSAVKMNDYQAVSPAKFPDDNYDFQYTLIFDNSTSTPGKVSGPSTVDIEGVTVRTAIRTANGIVQNESFVPYSKT